MQETSEGHYGQERLKLHGLDAQREFAAFCTEWAKIKRTFTSAASTSEYDLISYLGGDIELIYDPVWYATTPLTSMPLNAQDVALTGNSQPRGWFIRDDGFNLWPTPDGAETVTVFGTRTPARWVLSLTHASAGAGETAVDYSITSPNRLLIAVTGGTHTGWGYSLDCAVDSLNGIAASINAAASTQGITISMAVSNEAYGHENGKYLELVATTSFLDNTLYLYKNPEVPRHLQRSLQYAIAGAAFLEDEELELGGLNVERWRAAMEESARLLHRSQKGFRRNQVADAYGRAGGFIEMPHLTGNIWTREAG